ncbi:MAG: xanthine dehydrogenase family protein subunit M [Candidatus Aminicenantaceae bacterium]
MIRFKYHKPRSLDEACKLKEKLPDARFIAGGTDLMVNIRKGELRPPALVSLRSIPGLCKIEIDEVTSIGALSTISDLIQNQMLPDKFPVLVQAAKRLGSVQIRNVATIGGNLCNSSPCADMALPLLVLEAKVKLQADHQSRVIPLSEFFVGPGKTRLAANEIMTEIILESPQKKTKTIFLKKGRVKMDLAIASVSVLLEMDGKKCRKVRIAAGSVGPVPMRLYKVEAMLEGATLSKELLDEAQKLAAESVNPITDVRASEEYRRQIIGVFVKRGIEKILGRNEP